MASWKFGMFVTACCVVALGFQCTVSAQTQAQGPVGTQTLAGGDNGTHQVIDKDKQTAIDVHKHLVVQVLPETPFIQPNPLSLYKFEGMFVDVLLYITQKANLTFEIHPLVDYTYGREYEPGKWNGLIGNLQDNETGIHLALAPLTISSARASVVDFTYPIMSSGLRILYKVPDPWSDSESFAILLSPFTPGLWAVLLLMFIAISVLFYVVGRFSPYEDHAFVGKAATYEGLTLLNSFLYVFSSLTFQGYTAAPRSLSGRVLAAFWWMFVLLVIAAYTASLCAIILAFKPSIKQIPFDSFSELVRQNQVAFGIVKGKSTEFYLKNSNRTIEKELYSRIVSNADKVMVTSIADGLNRLKRSNGDFAMIMEGPLAEYEAGHQPCDLMVLGEELGHHAYAFACKKGTDVCGKLNAAVIQMLEEDYIQSLQQKWLRRDCPDHGSGEYIYDSVPFFDTFGGQMQYYAERSMTLRRFGTGFLVLFVGFFASACLLLGEIFYAKRRGVAVPQRIPRTGVDDSERIDREYKDDADA